MEMHLTDPPTSDSLPASKRPAVRLATCTRTLHLFYSFTCLSVLCFSTVASENPLCERVEVYHGFSLRTKYDAHSIQFIGGPQTLDSCQAHCCKTLHCTVYWLLDDTCILADCMKQRCARARIDSGASKLVVMKKSGVAGPTMLHYSPERISLQGAQSWIAWARMSAEFFNTLQRRIKPLRIKRELGAADEKSENDPGAQPLPSTQSNQNGTNNDTIKVTEIEKATPIPSTLLPTARPPAGNEPAQAHGNSTESAPLDSPPDTEKEAPGSVTLVPSSISINTSTQPTPAPTSTSPTATVTNKLVVSAGNSVQVTLPKNSVQLNAFVLPEPPEDTTYTYDWRLITHPTDYSGEMEGKHSQALKLSKLTAGLYEFKVIVDGYKAHGEGFVNVTVNPEPRVNQPPIAIVSPRYQEISLPTTSTVIDGSQSTDDDKIVSYHWEEMKGPLREEKVSADTAILKLTNLVPGNYTFSLTVTDSDGAKNSTTANLTVIKAVDYPPVANAGANQVITLPRNSIILYGNLSTDDHGIVSYEWSLSPNSKGKVMEMQGVRTSTLQLSALQEGDYTFLLTVTDSTGQQSSSEVTVIVQPENNKPPEADPGPDKELTLPVDSTTLDGSRSTDDQKIVSYLWEQTRGPDGVKIENANSSIARLTGLQVGNYEFTLTVKDERDLKSQATVSVIVKEEINKPPEAKIAGNVVITLPSNTAELDGSKSTDDQGIVGYQWERDESSPAAGDVLNNSDHHSVLFLSNLVEGTYTFHLKVTDAKGESDTDRATVEVKPDPMKNNLVEMILDVNVSQLTERQKGMFMRQIGVLLGVLDSDITVQKIQLYTEQSTKVVFYVRNQPPRQIMKGYQVAWRLRNELRKQQSDFLIFRALEIDTFTCQLNCSLHGHCNSVTKRCVCDPFWMENILRRQFGDGESNCEWSILYVVISSFLSVVALGLLVWGVICCCRRKKGKPKRKSRYKMLDATDDQESMEMKSSIKTGVKMKSPAQNTSLMHSESELDSDENAYTWSDREKGKLLRPQNGSLRNGHASHKTKIQREEVL